MAQEQRRRRARRIDAGVLARIDDLAINHGLGASAIERALRDDEEMRQRGGASLRTIQDRVRELLPRTSGGDAWRLEDADPDEGRAVLEVLAEMARVTNGKRSSLSRDQAAWVVRIDRAAPGLLAWDRYRLAVAYSARSARGEPTADLDMLVGFHPWASERDNNAYRRAIADGAIPEPPRHLLSVATPTLSDFAEVEKAFGKLRRQEEGEKPSD
ncbi:MAG: hypothetical protein M0R73_12490 [Dehalococcoidia bacterium]|nr:hypothetical protein [Dehalococcoidia bacterium]